MGAGLVGACLPWILVGLYTLTQRKTPMGLQGRVRSTR